MRSFLLRAGVLFLVAAALVLSPISQRRVQAQTQGIDVSQWQGAINWGAVKASGVDFVMVRVGNTKYGLDTQFAANVVGANAAGLRVGAYVYTYATTVQEAVADATLAVAAMAGLPISFPVAIDMEDSCHKSLTPQQQADIVNAFCMVIYQAGYSPMVYASKSWFIDRMGPVPWDHWVAMYNSYCDYPGYTMWQATDKGRVSGIGGNVDIDYLFKDYASLIPANGFSDQAGMTYLFLNYRKQFGLQAVGGLQYFFDGTGAMVKNVTNVDAAGNIIRYCQDGHIVVITIVAQQYAAAAALQLQQAIAAQAQAEAASAAAAAASEAALAQAQTLQAQSDEMQQALAVLTEQAALAPTEELLAQLTLTQQQSEVLAAQAAQALEMAVSAQQNAAAMQTAALQAQQQTALLEQVNAAAQAAIVVPQ